MAKEMYCPRCKKMAPISPKGGRYLTHLIDQLSKCSGSGQYVTQKTLLDNLEVK